MRFHILFDYTLLQVSFENNLLRHDSFYQTYLTFFLENPLNLDVQNFRVWADLLLALYFAKLLARLQNSVFSCFECTSCNFLSIYPIEWNYFLFLVKINTDFIGAKLHQTWNAWNQWRQGLRLHSYIFRRANDLCLHCRRCWDNSNLQENPIGDWNFLADQ